MIGRQFGRLTVLADIGRVGHARKWLCRCICGEEKPFRIDHLTSGRSRSCGCLNSELARALMTTHGGASGDKSKRHPLYSVWCGMKKRCYDENCVAYPWYGGRGITVSDVWLDDFARFCSDMGGRPSKLHTIDRIDVERGYGPDNCRWATKAEQVANRAPWGSRRAERLARLA